MRWLFTNRGNMIRYKIRVMFGVFLMLAASSVQAEKQRWFAKQWGAVKNAVAEYSKPTYAQQASGAVKDHPYAVAVAAGAVGAYVLYPCLQKLVQAFKESTKKAQFAITFLAGGLTVCGLKTTGASLRGVPTVDPWVAVTGLAAFVGFDYLRCRDRLHKR